MRDLTALREAVKAAYGRMDSALAEWEGVSEDASDEVRKHLEGKFDAAKAAHAKACESLERAEAMEEARAALPVPPNEAGTEPDEEGRTPATPAARVEYDPETGRVGGEESVYHPRGKHSFLKDQLAAQKGDGDALERILRAGRELASVGKPHRDKYGEVMQERAIAETAGAGGELVAPLYLQHEYLVLARAARPYFDALSKRPLPPNANSINIPALETGTATAAQADLGAVKSKDLKTKLLTFPVITVAGQQDFARQLFDRSVPELADYVVFPDLVADYLTQTDVQALSGNGSSPNAKGVLSAVLSGGKVTFTSGTPKVKELYSKMADAIQRIHTKRFLPPTAIIMHPRRWGWLLASVDTAERPLILPSDASHFNSVGSMTQVASEAIVGTMLGLPVIVDSSLPTNEGAGTNQDPIIIQRTDDAWVLEDEPVKTRVFEEVLSNELAIRAQVFNYLALTHERYAASICTITGTGLVEPTF